MSWRLSRFRAGDMVVVRSAAEILATLDEEGRLESLPFMPEMLQYCGKLYRVRSVAHKACDMIAKPGTGRRMSQTVHLEGLRCDGSAHGGCQADCNIFWKDAWLQPANGERAAAAAATRKGCTQEQLQASTIATAEAEGAELRYSCQATRLFEATQPLAWWDFRQYVYDWSTGNRSFGHVLKLLFLAGLRNVGRRMPLGYNLFKAFSERMHQRFTGKPMPSFNPGVPDGQQTPTGSLGLQRGEVVRIKSRAEIEQTLNRESKNRGMFFDPDDMGLFCGETFTVRGRVTRIVDERTGRMLQMKNPCILLEGAVCRSQYASCRLNCPREFPSYWREIWLERAAGQSGSSADSTASAVNE